jgi:hypothetical protein
LASANIVGYKTFTLRDQYTLIGICFDDVAGTGMTLNQLAPYSEGNGMTKGLARASADNIQVMGEDNNYTTYFLSNGKYGKGGNSYNADLDGKWLAIAGAECTDTVKPGQAFWYISQTAATTPHTITVAGQVLDTAETAEKICSDTYTLMGNPYACEVPLNGGVITTGATKATARADADNIQVMGEDGQYTTYFLSNGKYGKGGNSYNEALDGKWLKVAGADCEDTIPVGGAFWYISRSKESTVKLVNPLQK